MTNNAKGGRGPSQDMGSIIAGCRPAVRPTARQQARAKRMADMLLELVGAEAKRHPEITRIELGGSYRKGTWLARPEMDVDVYMRFKPRTARGRFRKIAIDVGLAALRDYSPYTKFTDHPYVEARLDASTLANVVPYYEIADASAGEWKSAADRSRFHTDYMARKLTADMRDDVRLLKSFLKTSGLYGAQIEREGFSGYVSEVLIAHFGGLEETIRQFADMEGGRVIGKASKEFGTMITITDPIDAGRNLAAAISDQNMVRFILACRAFEREPSAQFFSGRRAKKSLQMESGERRRHWGNILSIRFGFEQRAPDIIWGQTKKSAAKLVKKLESGGFAVTRHAYHVDIKGGSGYLFALLASDEIPRTYKQEGPEFHMREGLNEFIKKSARDSAVVWVDSQGRLSALKRRDETSAHKYARRLLENKGSRDALLPAGYAAGPETWMGAGNMDGAAKEAAGGLISTDAAIVYLS